MILDVMTDLINPLRFWQALILIAGAMVCVASLAQMTQKLENLQDEIESSYPEVFHLDAIEVDGGYLDEAVVFDVREPGEYAVSKLKGAIQIDPDITVAEFLDSYGSKVAGKEVLFYCSVGYRSSLFASKVQSELEQKGAVVSNLRGGIFHWHNEKRSLESQAGETDYIHPYSWRWQRYLERKSFSRYEPE